MGFGMMEKILWVDLSTGEMRDEPLDEKTARMYLGGYGLGARILFDRQKPGVDPLGPEATLGFVTGLLTGTDGVGGSRYVVVGKSPLTGGWGDANSGGDFGPGLKFAGYDAVFVTGVAGEAGLSSHRQRQGRAAETPPPCGARIPSRRRTSCAGARQGPAGGLHRSGRREGLAHRLAS